MLSSFIKRISLIALACCLSFLTLSAQGDPATQFTQSNTQYILSHGRTRVVCSKTPNGTISCLIQSKNELGDFASVLQSFQPDYSGQQGSNTKLLYNTKLVPKRYLVDEILSHVEYDSVQHCLLMHGERNGIHFSQRVFITSKQDVYIDVEGRFPSEINQLDYMISAYTYNIDRSPSFVHTPAAKFDNFESGQNRFDINRSNQQVIGDRSFHAPAVVLQEGKLFAALIPDLDAINKYRVLSPDARRTNRIGTNMYCVPEVKEHYTMPTALDYTAYTGVCKQPVLSFGYMDAIIGHHIRYNRPDDSSMIRTIHGSLLKYAFTLQCDAMAAPLSYKRVSQFIWEHYGSKEFASRPHLPMPYNEYHRIIDSITFKPSQHADIDIPLDGYRNTGSWLEWEENGMPMGGYRSAINWWNDKLHNSAFWNNAREAAGFWFWGKRLGSDKEMQRAQRIINWCLSAPRNEQGLFATLYHANTRTWALQFTDPAKGKYSFFNNESSSYDIATMSKTAAHLLFYYLNCEPDERIVQYLRPYGDWLTTVVDEKGCVPSFVTDKMVPLNVLYYSAHPAASMWFLAELYNATKDKKYLQAAEKIATYMQRDIIPEARWIDFELFFSCGQRPFYFERDIVQDQYTRGSLCVIWASEGFAALHRATHKPDYLASGEACVDYLAFTQTSWNPHYVYTAYPFGGSGVDNADCSTFLDARQAEYVEPMAYFGKALNRRDLMERAIAAGNASSVLINHPAHKANNIYRYTNIYPFGLGPENIDHEGIPQSAMRTHPSWGEGSGIYTGLAGVLRNFGGLYINKHMGLVLGVDGVRVNTVKTVNGKMSIEVESSLSKKYLEQPWNKPFSTNMVFGEGGSEDVQINNKSKQPKVVLGR